MGLPNAYDCAVALEEDETCPVDSEDEESCDTDDSSCEYSVEEEESVGWFATASASSCFDYDGVDSYGDSCASWYNQYPDSCGYYDWTDFEAAYECCACGGGSTEVPTCECYSNGYGFDSYCGTGARFEF